MVLPDQATLNTLMYFSVLAYSSDVPVSITPSVKAPTGQEADWSTWTALNGTDLDTPVIPTHIFFGKNNFYKFANAQAIVAVNDTDDALILAFKGTDIKSLADWLEDIFYINAYYYQFTPLPKSIDYYLSQNPNIKNVYVTGDSLGAGAAEQYMYNHPDTASVSFEAITFGSPGFVLKGDAPHDERVTNVMHAGDPVPWLGHVVRGYKSIGTDMPMTLFDFDDGSPPPTNFNEHFKGLYQLNLFYLTNSALYRLADSDDEIVLGVGPAGDPPPGTSLPAISYDDVIDKSGLDTSFFLLGLAGDDDLTGGTGPDLLDGGAGKDVLQGNAGDDALAGGKGRDLLHGGPDNDTFVFVARDGVDTIDEQERGGLDVLEIHSSALRNIDPDDISYWLSGGKHDLAIGLVGGDQGTITIAQMDVALSQVETLRLFDADGNQVGPDVDLVQKFQDAGSGLDDVILLSKGHQEVFAGGGHDIMEGGVGNDRLHGGRGRDTIDGGKGNDKLWGGNGHDVLEGGNGDDTLRGGSGRDTINGGKGNDKLSGGKAGDNFVFDQAPGGRHADKIKDFADGADLIVLDASSFDGLTAGEMTPQQFKLHIAYDSNGWLSFDNQKFAKLQSGGIDMDHTDFLVI